MFFVGITGSLIPFLFLLGVVFVFSIQTSAQALDDAPKLDEDTPLSHQFYCPSTLESESEADFHFSQAFADSFDWKITQMSGMHCMVQCLAEAVTPGNPMRMRGLLLTDGKYSSCFPGLSPPRCC